MKTVVICDTEPIAVEGLRVLLAGSEMRIDAVESCLASAVDAVHDLRPSLLIVDKAFGFHSVLDAIRGLMVTAPDTRIAVWSSVLTDSEALRLMHAGALGVARKTMALDQLLECFESAVRAVPWMDGSAMRIGQAPVRARAPLTARELQVLELVERGLTNREIALELGIRAGTVKIHLKHIFEKTGVRGRYGLALSGLKDRCPFPAAVLI